MTAYQQPQLKSRNAFKIVTPLKETAAAALPEVSYVGVAVADDIWLQMERKHKEQDE